MKNKFESKFISTILLTNNHVQNFAGSELVTFDLALFFSGLGIDVTVATFSIGSPMSELFRKTDIRVVDLSLCQGELLGKSFDLVWGHHWPVIGHCLYELGVKFRYLVVSSLSPIEPLEQLIVGAAEADVLLCHSKNNLEGQIHSLFADAASKTKVFPNSLSEEWFVPNGPQSARNQTSIAVVSNHVPRELVEALASLKDNGVIITIYGLSNTVERVTPPLLDNYSAVITIGHTVQKALARGLPIYCYDRFGGPGWISKNNLDLAEEYNFSGRCTGRKLTPQELAGEIALGLDEVRPGEVSDLQGIARERYSLSINVQSTLAMLPEPRPNARPADSNAQHRMLCQLYVNHAIGINISALVNEKSDHPRKLYVDDNSSEERARYFEIFSAEKLPRLVYKNAGDLVICGVALAKKGTPYQLARIMAIDCEGKELANAVLGLYSPGVGNTFPNMPFSYSARYRLTVPTINVPSRFDLIAIMRDGTRVHLYSISMG